MAPMCYCMTLFQKHSESFRQPRLLQGLVGSVARPHTVIDREVPIRDGAVLNLVVALTRSDKGATCCDQSFLQIPQIARHRRVRN